MKNHKDNLSCIAVSNVLGQVASCGDNKYIPCLIFHIKLNLTISKSIASKFTQHRIFRKPLAFSVCPIDRASRASIGVPTVSCWPFPQIKEPLRCSLRSCTHCLLFRRQGLRCSPVWRRCRCLVTVWIRLVPNNLK